MRRIARGLTNLDFSSRCRYLPTNRRFATNGVKKLPVQCLVDWESKESGTAHLVGKVSNNLLQQQVRMYAPAASGQVATECWNCRKMTQRKNHMICAECGHLQDVNADINYFDLLDFPKSFDIEAQTLTRRFRQLQTLVHPDKFSNKTTREQDNSAEWSALINKAYKTLSVPIERGQYILKMHGEQISESNSSLDKAFLMEMMERNEEVDEADSSEDLERLNQEIVKSLNVKIIELDANFQKNALDAAKSILIQMKYLISIQKSIKTKLQTLMGAS